MDSPTEYDKIRTSSIQARTADEARADVALLGRVIDRDPNGLGDHGELWTEEGARVLLVVPPEDYMPFTPATSASAR